MAEPAASTPAQSFVFAAVRRVAALIIPLGFGLGDFLRIAKSAFVDAATDHIRARGGRVSTSQIAVITGLSRSEVSAIRAKRSVVGSSLGTRRTERVMHGWYGDPEFVNERGIPKTLSLTGEMSFNRLVKRFGGDVTPKAVLRELVAGGMARIDESGRLAAVGRYHQPPPDSQLDFQRLASDLDVLLSSGAGNDDAKGLAARRTSVRFSGAVSIAVQKNISLRIGRFLDAMSEYLHTMAMTAPDMRFQHGASRSVHVLVAHAITDDSSST